MPILKNPKHEIIAQRLAAGDNGTKALIAAGYSAKSASSSTSRLFAKFPGIQARCEELQAQKANAIARAAAQGTEREEVDRRYVRVRLQAVAERCMVAEPVLVRGMPTGQYQFDSGGANRALELLGKDLGMFVDRKEVGLPGSFASVEDRKAAELRVKAKMVKLGLARVVGAGSMIGKKSGESADLPATVEKSTPVDQPAQGGSVEIPTPDVLSKSRHIELEPPDQIGEPDPPKAKVDADRDLAPLPPGVNEHPAGEPDPFAEDRAKVLTPQVKPMVDTSEALALP